MEPFAPVFVTLVDEFTERLLDYLDDVTYPSYEGLLRLGLDLTIEHIEDMDDTFLLEEPDTSRIHVIDDGSYQGIKVFVIPAVGYQPYEYWVTKVSYGSCGGCDSLADAMVYSEEPNTAKLYTLTLHMLQRLKQI